jgi:tetratricopeptide (TPR) repeat protein
MLYALGVRGADVPESLDASVGTYRSLTAGRRILVLLDNALDVTQIRPLLPNSADSLVLVTSRVPQLGLAASDGARLLHLDLPDLPTARRLLGRRLEQTTRHTTTDDAGVVDAVIELCGRLPLALAVVAARLSVRPGLPLGSVAAELRDGARRLEAFPIGPGVRDPRTAFAWSYRQLSPDAARLFRLLSVAMTAGITVRACASLCGQDTRSARKHLRELERAALVTEDEHGRYTSHVLVKAYADELLSDEAPGERTAAVSRLLHHYLRSAENAQAKITAVYRVTGPLLPAPVGVCAEQPASYGEAVDWFGRHREVVLEAVRAAGDLGEVTIAWRLALAVATDLQTVGRYRDWNDIVDHTLRLAREHGDVVAEAQLARSLAGARFFTGAHDETLDLLETALQIFTKAGMYAEELAVHDNFGLVYVLLEQYDLVVEHSRKAAALGRLVGDRDAELLGLRAEGNAHYYLKEYDRAISVYEHALTRCDDLTHRLAAWDLRWAIGENLLALGRFDQAIDLLTVVCRESDELGQKPLRFSSRASLTKALIAVGDTAGARGVFDEAAAVLESLHLHQQVPGTGGSGVGGGRPGDRTLSGTLHGVR